MRTKKTAIVVLGILISFLTILPAFAGDKFCYGLMPAKQTVIPYSKGLSFDMAATIGDVERGTKVFVDGKEVSVKELKRCTKRDPLYYVLATMHQGFMSALAEKIFNIERDIL